MAVIAEAETFKAYQIWLRTYKHGDVERVLHPFLNDQITGYVRNEGCWLKTIRRALFLSTETVAANMKARRATYCDYEKREQLGTISFACLARAAEAMDCELVYAIRPKDKIPFSKKVWEMLLEPALNHPFLKVCDPNRKAEALASIAKSLQDKPEFYRKQGWSQRKKN